MNKYYSNRVKNYLDMCGPALTKSDYLSAIDFFAVV